MNQDTNKLSSENNISFPLTLSKAIQHLADQKTNNIQCRCKKSDQIRNKTWQQLSARLRLVFNTFSKTQNRYKYEFNYIHDAANCLQHQLSKTNLNSITKKLEYIYCAVTMHYLQRLDSTFLPTNVPQQWIQREDDTKLDLNNFSLEIRAITNYIPTKPKKENPEFKTVKLEGLPTETIIKLINHSENIVNTTYDYIKQHCISYQKIRGLLSGIDGYSGNDVYTHMRQKFQKLRIERTLRNNFEEYKYFDIEYDLLKTIYDKTPQILKELTLEGNYMTQSSLVAMWDETSKTNTEVSPLEFEFFSYLLQNIPTRKKGEKHNVANYIFQDKWYVLPREVRDKITDYILKMVYQPSRIARFLGDQNFDEEDDKKAKLLSLQIEDICFHIRFPHRYNAYCKLKDLYSPLIEQQEIFRFDKLDENIEKLSEIQLELQKAREETV